MTDRCRICGDPGAARCESWTGRVLPWCGEDDCAVEMTENPLAPALGALTALCTVVGTVAVGLGLYLLMGGTW